ncbi:hypothetical protein LTR36_008975 [Oleoguttula mirabilis]|uniref:Arginyl-tRNA--protein transferase 1 n=1 Tax=Oleoguttula mirabilis TaxID=1507867 RepID=A0AAV9J6K5_9PEZI|nr:hypothetical protein LTR36_008975 [Oleoguttula mirabilis]
MDRGWRRLPAAELKPSRDQRQTLNRWNRFVLGEKYLKEVSAKHPKSKAEKKRENNTFDLASAVHEGEVAQLRPDIEPEHKFEVTLEPDTLTEEKYALFADYQRHVHHEGEGDISRAGFKRFLCSSPLHQHVEPGGKKLGSYHQCYRLDGRLVAMGVLDLLPHGVSGVYFLYHHDFEKWSFGKLSALRETVLALEGGYEYYYMGYYIHGCKKMRYKGDYKPQFVLDFHSLQWDLLDEEMRSLMDRRKYASMSNERQRQARLQEHAGRVHCGDKSPTLTETTDESAEASATADEEEQVRHPVPVDAFNSGLSLLELGMPGVLSLDELRAEVDLETMKVYLGQGGIHEMQDIVSWRDGNETNTKSIKGTIAEFAAAAGPAIASGIVCDFSRPGA